MFGCFAVILLSILGGFDGNAMQAFDHIPSNADIHLDQNAQETKPTSFIDRYVSNFLSDFPMENEENKEEEEVNEEEVRLKKVSVKDFYYTDLMCCRALEFLSEYESHSNQTAFIAYHYPKYTECNYLLFQVFRL